MRLLSFISNFFKKNHFPTKEEGEELTVKKREEGEELPAQGHLHSCTADRTRWNWRNRFQHRPTQQAAEQ